MTQAPPFSDWRPIVVPGARSLPLTLDGRPYELSIAAPDTPPPPSGYPLILLLDAAGSFISAAEIARRLAARAASTGIRPCVVVGLDSLPPGAERYRIFTAGPPAFVEDLPRDVGEMGGAAAFLALLIDRVLPVAERLFPIDGANRALLGHSLSAYFSLLALAMRPNAFTAYGAFSPSLWWDLHALETQIAQADISRASVFLAAGADEEPAGPATARHDRRKMVSRLRDFAAQIQPRVLRSECLVLAGENHGSMRYAALSQFIRFAQNRAAA